MDNIKYLKVNTLQVGKTYREHLIEDEPEEMGSELDIIILKNDKKYLVVYQSGSWGLSKGGLEFLLKVFSREDAINHYNSDDFEIDTYDYQQLTGKEFFEKWGFHDEGIIVYSDIHEYHVINDFVGDIKFYNPKL